MDKSLRRRMPPLTPHEHSDRWIGPAQLVCFLMTFVGFWGNVFIPHQTVSLKLIDASFATGSILLAVTLAREGWDMAAAGYTLLAIGWGVLFAGLDFIDARVGNHIFSSAGYFFFPA